MDIVLELQTHFLSIGWGFNFSNFFLFPFFYNKLFTFCIKLFTFSIDNNHYPTFSISPNSVIYFFFLKENQNSNRFSLLMTFELSSKGKGKYNFKNPIQYILHSKRVLRLHGTNNSEWSKMEEKKMKGFFFFFFLKLENGRN